MKEGLSRLGKILLDDIKITGPMSVNKYIKSCLVHPLGGYYTARDVFGTKGDFTTSPEISQMFGEMIGIFFVNAWKKQSFSMLELGPGRGTLLQDVLRTMQQFKMTPKTVHLVEQSPFLREMQRKRWDITDNKNPQGTVFEWHDTIDTVPKETFMVLSHEFFDALPVFKFERTEKGWRELLVDQDDDQESPYHFKLVRSPVPTQTQEALKSQLAGDKSRIEISPETQFHTREISAKMDKESIWLNVDYGQDGPSEDSLRGIKDHKFVSPFSEPGNVDLSVNVNFDLIRKSTPHYFHPLLTQQEFLTRMGMNARMMQLLQACKTTEQRQGVLKDYERLVVGMGTAYKFSCITTEQQELYPFAQ